jgi:hypothetical protein
MSLFSVLILISMSIVGYEVYKNYNKSASQVIETDKCYDYMLLEDDKNVELYEYKEELGIRDI